MMRSLRWFILAVVTAVAAANPAAWARAADPEKVQPPTKEQQEVFDAKVRKSLFDLINHGVDLYNGGEIAACYQLYDGSLRTVMPLLDHHPDLQKAIGEGLKEAQTLPSADKQAFHLRRVLDKARADLKGGAAGAPVVKSLWERLGSDKGVARLVDDFVGLAATDPKVNFSRDGKYKLDEAGMAKLKRHSVEMISAATGGPLKYSGPEMKDFHKDMGITDAEFDAAVADLKKALDKSGTEPTDAAALVKIVESTRRDIVAPKKPVESPVAKPLWDRLGGEKGVGKIVDDLLAVVSADPKVNFSRKQDVKPTAEQMKATRERVIDYVSSKTGGPRKYEGKSMKAVHAGMGITEDQFDVFVSHAKAVLMKNGVKDDDIQTLVDAVNSTKKDIVETKKPDDRKPDDKKADDKKVDDKKPDDKKADDKKADDKKPTDKPADDKKPADKKPDDK